MIVGAAVIVGGIWCGIEVLGVTLWYAIAREADSILSAFGG